MNFATPSTRMLLQEKEELEADIDSDVATWIDETSW